MIRCLVVDDEEPARELIRLHLSALEGFGVVASLTNALDAFAFLQKQQVDLIFLDINMPKVSGLELLRSLRSTPKVILTTAYREHAADAFELEVFDYLVKPITRERFMKAIARFLHDRNNNGQVSSIETVNSNNNNAAHIFLKVGREQVRVMLKDILYMEGLADYIKVHTPDKFYIASDRLSHMEDKLPGNAFVRIHKSFIIALDKITSFNADQVMVGNQALPLGRLYKAGFLKAAQRK